jgi:hypothetical protein
VCQAVADGNTAKGADGGSSGASSLKLIRAAAARPPFEQRSARAIAIQSYNEWDLRRSREAEVREVA